MDTTDPATPTPTAMPTPTPDCQNCGTPLLGDHCYRCGQPVKGLVRHFSSIIGDFLDSVLEFDSRTLRTLGPLLFRPGALTLDYFAGRRVRYVSPIRLFVFLSLFAFLAAQWSIDVGQDALTLDEQVVRFHEVSTLEALDTEREAALARIDAARAKLGNGPEDAAVRLSLDIARKAVIGDAARRARELSAQGAGPVTTTPATEAAADDADVSTTESAPPAGTAAARGAATPDTTAPSTPSTPEPRRVEIRFGDSAWHATDNPLRIGWLPDAANAWLNRQIARGESNIARVQQDPGALKDAFIGALPSTLIVLLPLFALLLKLAYVFSGRLYMEHLVVALHSHSFLCLALLLWLVLDALGGWLGGWPQQGLVWLQRALLLWMPVYLVLMQKRVYGQGWPMTLIKAFVLGNLHQILLMGGALITVLVSLVSL